MQIVLIYAFAAAVLGGIDSPVGAVVGGLLLGVAPQPARYLRRLHRRRAAAAGRAAGHPRRPPRPAGRPLRQAAGEEGLMPSRATTRTLIVFAVLARRRLRPACLRQRLPRAAVLLRRHLPRRADRARHPHRLHGPDLARPRRVHGDRRLHDRDPDDRPRRQGHLDDPACDRRRGHRRRSSSVSRPRASPASTWRSRRSGSRSRRPP